MAKSDDDDDVWVVIGGSWELNGNRLLVGLPRFRESGLRLLDWLFFKNNFQENGGPMV